MALIHAGDVWQSYVSLTCFIVFQKIKRDKNTENYAVLNVNIIS